MPTNKATPINPAQARQKLDCLTRYREALEELLSNLPFGIEDACRITTIHPSGVSGTMGPNLTNALKESIKKAKQALQETQRKG